MPEKNAWDPLYASPSEMLTWRYNAGFLHAKVQAETGVVEIRGGNSGVIVEKDYFRDHDALAEPAFVQDVKKMFTADFARNTRATSTEFTARPWWFCLGARTSRLRAAVQ